MEIRWILHGLPLRKASWVSVEMNLNIKSIYISTELALITLFKLSCFVSGHLALRVAYILLFIQTGIHECL